LFSKKKNTLSTKVAKDAEKTINSLMGESCPDNNAETKPDLSTFCEVLLKEEESVPEEALKKIEDDMAEFNSTSNQNQVNDEDVSVLKISDVRSVAGNGRNLDKTSAEKARQNLLSTLKTFMPLIPQDQRKEPNNSNFRPVGSGANIIKPILITPNHSIPSQQNDVALHSKTPPKQFLRVKSISELRSPGKNVVLSKAPFSTQITSENIQGNEIDTISMQSNISTKKMIIQKTPVQIQGNHPNVNSKQNQVIVSSLNTKGTQNPPNSTLSNKRANSVNVLGRLNKNSTIIMLPKGVQIGPNNPVRIVNPVSRKDINASTTTTGGTYKKTAAGQIKSIKLVTPSSILKGGNLLSETLNSSSSFSSQLTSGQMSYIGGKIIQLPGNSSHSLNKVNAKVVGTHITSGEKVCKSDRPVNRLIDTQKQTDKIDRYITVLEPSS